MRIALALAIALLAPLALACEMMQYQRVRASDHVHVFEAAEGTTAVVNGNIVAVVGRDAILVVDTGQFPSIAKRVLADIRALSPAPIRYVVNTHWHGDHLLGNSVFKEAFPAARFIAHSHTIEQGPKFYSDYAAKSRQRLPAIVADMKKRLAESASDEEKLWITLLASIRAQLTAMHARGVARADAASRLDAGPFRERYLTTAVRRQALDQFFVKAAIAEIWPKP